MGQENNWEPAEQLVTGVIIGSVQFTGCVRDSRSRWAIPGYEHWLTAEPRRVAASLLAGLAAPQCRVSWAPMSSRTGVP